jgi:hypothetical protein
METIRKGPSKVTRSDDERCAECGAIFPTANAVAEHQSVHHQTVVGAAERRVGPIQAKPSSRELQDRARSAGSDAGKGRSKATHLNPDGQSIETPREAGGGRLEPRRRRRGSYPPNAP